MRKQKKEDQLFKKRNVEDVSNEKGDGKPQTEFDSIIRGKFGRFFLKRIGSLKIPLHGIIFVKKCTVATLNFSYTLQCAQENY